MNEQGNQAASRCTSDEAMIERLVRSLRTPASPREARTRASSARRRPRWGTDAYVMWNALTLEFFPHRAGSALA